MPHSVPISRRRFEFELLAAPTISSTSTWVHSSRTARWRFWVA
jgi:hypothetical protein